MNNYQHNSFIDEIERLVLSIDSNNFEQKTSSRHEKIFYFILQALKKHDSYLKNNKEITNANSKKNN